MINAKVSDKSVQIQAAVTGAELAFDVLRIVKALYDDLLENDTVFKLGMKDFRTTIMLFIEDVLDYEKLETKDEKIH